MANLAKAYQEIVKRRRSVRIYNPKADFDSQIIRDALELATLAPNSSNLQLWEFYQITSKDAKKTMAKFCLNQPAAVTANELVVFVARKDLYKKRAQWNLNQVEESFRKEGVEIPKAKHTRDAGSVLNSSGGGKQQRLKSLQQYYGKLIPQLYSNDWFGIYGLVKQLYVNWFMAPKKPVYREVRKSDIDVIVNKSVALAAQTFMLALAAHEYDTCPMEGFDSKRIKRFLNLPNAAEITMVISCGIGTKEGHYGKRNRVPKDEVIFKV